MTTRGVYVPTLADKYADSIDTVAEYIDYYARCGYNKVQIVQGARSGWLHRRYIRTSLIDPCVRRQVLENLVEHGYWFSITDNAVYVCWDGEPGTSDISAVLQSWDR